jgi:hypothetical protein
MIRFIAPYTFVKFGTKGKIALSLFYTLQFTVTHALGFSFLTSRILATDLSESHWNFKSHMKSSWHSQISFLPFVLSGLRLPSPELESVLFRLLFYTMYTPSRPLTAPSYNSSARIPRKRQPPVVKESCSQLRCPAIDVPPLRAVVSGKCLPIRCLAMGIYVTIFTCFCICFTGLFQSTS